MLDFTYKELALLNKMISISLMNGEVEFNEISESVHKKVADEIVRKSEDKEN